MIILEGQNDLYEFDPEKDLVKSGGKFSMLFKGMVKGTESHVAIKTLAPDLLDDPDEHKALAYEASLVFDHPQLARHLDFIEKEGKPYLISDWIAGKDLKTLMLENKFFRKMPWQDAVGLTIKLAGALEALHREGVFHRDLKPSNIILNATGKGKPVFENVSLSIVDFGMAIRDQDVTRLRDESVRPFSMVYAAPEQVLNFHTLTNASTDLYALSVILYELLTGRSPFHDEHPLKLMTLQLVYDLPPHRLIPKPLLNVLLKATSKHAFKLPPSQYMRYELRDMLTEARDKRYQSAAEFQAALEESLEKVEKKSFRWPWK